MRLHNQDNKFEFELEDGDRWVIVLAVVLSFIFSLGEFSVSVYPMGSGRDSSDGCLFPSYF